MGKYERQMVEVGSLHDGDTFELPSRPDTICRVNHTSLINDDDGTCLRVIGYDIIEGPLHWPVIYCPPGSKVALLLPTTTHVHLSGKDWVNSLTEQHGVR